MPVAGDKGFWSAGQGPVTRRIAVPLREFLDTEVAGWATGCLAGHCGTTSSPSATRRATPGD
jgi:hypothetical protein